MLADPAAIPASFARLVRSEVRLVFGRRRNQVLLAALSCVPLLIGVAVKLSSDDGGGSGDGPPFLNQITTNGLFLVFTALVVCLPLFLPLTVGIVSGDALSGEANLGTLRYLLTVPVSRSRLLVAKWVGSASFAAAAVGCVVLVGLGTGVALFPVGPVTLLSGDTVSLANGLLRGFGVGLLVAKWVGSASFAVAAVGCVVLVGVGTGVALFPIGPVTLLSGDTVSLANGLLRGFGVGLLVAVSLLGLVTIGLFVSTLTEVPVAAMATTVVLAVVFAVLDGLPQVSALHPYLLTHHWYDFDELLRLAPDRSLLLTGLAVQLSYVALFGALAWSRFTTADVSA